MRGLRGPRGASDVTEEPEHGLTRRELTFGFQPEIWLHYVMWVATHVSRLGFLWFPGWFSCSR